MHKIIFKELAFKNFMSYGNNVNTFSFRNGLLWLYGDNGFGKSTIVEAMTFALFGISYRGGTKADLRNSRNHPKDLPEDSDIPDVPTEVKLEFDIETAPGECESYRISRTISGKKDVVKFNLEKMEGENWVQQNKRAGFSQADFEEKILQFNDVLFKNVIAMNTQETIPFFMMPAAKKRELLESIIAMSLDKWKKANGKRLSDATLEFSVTESDISQYTTEIAEMERIYQKMLDERSGNIEQMKDELTTVEANITAARGAVSVASGDVQKCSDILDGFRQELGQEFDVDREISALSSAVSIIPTLDAAQKRVSDTKIPFEAAEIEYNRYNFDELCRQKREIETNISRETRNIQASLEVNRINSAISTKSAEKQRLSEQWKAVVPGVPCPTCGKPSTEEDVKRQKDSIAVQGKAVAEEINRLKESLKDAEAEVTKHELLIDNMQNSLKSVQISLDDCTNFKSRVYIPAKAAYDTACDELARIERVVHDNGDDVDAIKAKIDALNTRKAEFPVIRQKFDAECSRLIDLKEKLATAKSNQRSLEEKKYRLEDDIRKAENTTDDSVAEMEARIKKSKLLKQDAETRMHEASDTIAVCKSIASICSDSGMKKMVFGMFVPAFNKAVQKNIIRANLPFIVTFDDTMDFHFESSPGLSKTYDMLSQGQKRKIGFAISMAFRDFVSLVGNFSVNFISLDEVLDISTDNNAMREMLDLVKEMVADIGCAVVITHRGDVVSDKFDYKLGITYDGLYSHLGKIENA